VYFADVYFVIDFLEHVSNFIFDVMFKGKNDNTIPKPISVFGPTSEECSDHPKFYCQQSIVKLPEDSSGKKQEKSQPLQPLSQLQSQMDFNHRFIDKGNKPIHVILIIDQKEVRCIEPFSGHLHWSMSLDDIKNYVVLEENVFAIILSEESYVLFSSEADKIEECIRLNKKKLQTEIYNNDDLTSIVESVARKLVANTLSQKQDLDHQKICQNVMLVVEPFILGEDPDKVLQDISKVVERLV